MALLVVQSLLYLEISGSNPVISKFYFLATVLKTVQNRSNKEKRPGMAQMLNTYLFAFLLKLRVFLKWNTVSTVSTYLPRYSVGKFFKSAGNGTNG